MAEPLHENVVALFAYRKILSAYVNKKTCFR